MLCAEGIARNGVPEKAPQEQPVTYREDLAARERLLPKVREIGAGALGIYRSGKELAAAGEALDALLQSGELRADSFTEQSALSIRMILQAAGRAAVPITAWITPRWTPPMSGNLRSERPSRLDK